MPLIHHPGEAQLILVMPLPSFPGCLKKWLSS